MKVKLATSLKDKNPKLNCVISKLKCELGNWNLQKEDGKFHFNFVQVIKSNKSCNTNVNLNIKPLIYDGKCRFIQKKVEYHVICERT